MDRIRILMFLIALATIPLFQNCHRGFGANPVLTQVAMNNGQPYDGMAAYVIEGGACADGTFVLARVVVTGPSTAALVRDNCETIAPKPLGPGDYTIDSTNTLQYNSQNFGSEKPAITIPLLATWYYQLTGTLQTETALVYDIDMFSATASTVQSLKSAGHIVICNISAGTYEPYRPDASSFQTADIGNPVSPGSQEKWVNTQSASIRTIMVHRLDLAKSLGCDGIDFDSVDAYANNSGFPLTQATQEDYNQYLTFAIHDRHLIAALKNDGDLVPDLVGIYDFSIEEQCFQFGECGKYQPFIDRGKAVLSAEYTSYSASQCSTAKAASLSLSFFNTALDGTTYQSCP